MVITLGTRHMALVKFNILFFSTNLALPNLIWQELIDQASQKQSAMHWPLPWRESNLQNIILQIENKFSPQ